MNVSNIFPGFASKVQRTAVVGALVVILSACATIQVDMDVYKGPLANHEDVEVEQFAVLASAAKPILHKLRTNIIDQEFTGGFARVEKGLERGHSSSEDGQPPLETIGDQKYKSYKTFLGEYAQQGYPSLTDSDQTLNCRNNDTPNPSELRIITETDLRCALDRELSLIVDNPRSPAHFVNEILELYEDSVLNKHIERIEYYSILYKDSRKRTELVDAHGDVDDIVNELLNILAIINQPKNGLTANEKAYAVKQVAKSLSNALQVRNLANVSQIGFCNETRQSPNDYEFTSSDVKDFMANMSDKIGETKDRWTCSNDASGKTFDKGLWRQDTSESRAKAREEERVALERTIVENPVIAQRAILQLRHYDLINNQSIKAFVDKKRDPTTASNSSAKEESAPGVPPGMFTKKSSAIKFLVDWTTLDNMPNQQGAKCREEKNDRKNNEACPYSQGYDKYAKRWTTITYLAETDESADKDARDEEENTLSSEEAGFAVVLGQLIGSQSSFGSTRLGTGIETLIGNYLTVSDRCLTAPTSGCKTKEVIARKRLRSALVRFAQKVSYLADNEILLKQNGSNIQNVGGRSVRPARLSGSNIEQHIGVLQSIGNTIIVLADDLHRMDDYADDYNTIAQINAANAAFSRQPIQRVVDLVSEAKQREAIATTSEKKEDATAKALQAEYVLSQKKFVETAEFLGLEIAANQNYAFALADFENEKLAFNKALLVPLKLSTDVPADDAKANRTHALAVAQVFAQKKYQDKLKETLIQPTPKPVASPADDVPNKYPQPESAVVAGTEGTVPATTNIAGTNPTPTLVKISPREFYEKIFAEIQNYSQEDDGLKNNLLSIQKYYAFRGKEATADTAVSYEIAWDEHDKDLKKYTAFWSDLVAYLAKMDAASAKHKITIKAKDAFKKSANNFKLAAIEFEKTRIELGVDGPGPGLDTFIGWIDPKIKTAEGRNILATYSTGSDIDIPDLISVDGKLTGPKSSQDRTVALDSVIAQLNYAKIEADSRGDKAASEKLKLALKTSYDYRGGLAFIRPAGTYLRNSYAASTLQKNSGIYGWQNKLQQQANRTWNPFANGVPGSSNSGQSISAEIDKQFWQTINTVKVSSDGDTNYVIAKDDVGNFYVKNVASDKAGIASSMRNLALFGLGDHYKTNLMERDSNDNVVINDNSTPMQTVYAQYEKRYIDATRTARDKVLTLLETCDLKDEEKTCAHSNPMLKNIEKIWESEEGKGNQDNLNLVLHGATSTLKDAFSKYDAERKAYIEAENKTRIKPEEKLKDDAPLPVTLDTGNDLIDLLNVIKTFGTTLDISLSTQTLSNVKDVKKTAEGAQVPPVEETVESPIQVNGVDRDINRVKYDFREAAYNQIDAQLKDILNEREETISNLQTGVSVLGDITTKSDEKKAQVKTPPITDND